MRKLSESIWTNINKRSEGNLERKEDDLSFIDDLKKDKFCDFLCDRYKQVPGEKWFIGDFGYAISFPIFATKDDNEGFSVFITGFRDRTKSVYVRDNFILNASDMLEKLKDNFTVSIIYKDTEPDWAEIYPKDKSKITNSFFVKVVDFILKNVDENKYKKVQEKV